MVGPMEAPPTEEAMGVHRTEVRGRARPAVPLEMEARMAAPGTLEARTPMEDPARRIPHALTARTGGLSLQRSETQGKLHCATVVSRKRKSCFPTEVLCKS